MQIFASCGPATVPLSVSADSTFTELEQRLSETLSLLPAEQAVVSVSCTALLPSCTNVCPSRRHTVKQDVCLALVSLFLLPLQWFQHRGRRCREEQTLAKAGLQDGSWVQVHLRLRGGGGDGGATGAESRSSYLEMYMKKKPDKVQEKTHYLSCKLGNQQNQIELLLSGESSRGETGAVDNLQALRREAGASLRSG